MEVWLKLREKLGGEWLPSIYREKSASTGALPDEVATREIAQSFSTPSRRRAKVGNQRFLPVVPSTCKSSPASAAASCRSL